MLKTENRMFLFALWHEKKRILWLCIISIYKNLSIYIIDILLFLIIFSFYGCKNEYAISDDSLKIKLLGLIWKNCLI